MLQIFDLDLPGDFLQAIVSFANYGTIPWITKELVSNYCLNILDERLSETIARVWWEESTPQLGLDAKVTRIYLTFRKRDLSGEKWGVIQSEAEHLTNSNNLKYILEEKQFTISTPNWRLFLEYVVPHLLLIYTGIGFQMGFYQLLDCSRKMQ